MEGLIGTISGFAVAIAAPFLIQLLKRLKWSGKKAKWFAFGMSALLALIWVLFSGAVPRPDTAGFLEFTTWLLGAITVVFTTATLIYRWFETKIFKKIPNLATLVKKHN